MILIDGLTEFSENSATCWVNINSESAFYDTDKNGVPCYVGIEYMAQSIAAFAGAKALNQGEDIRVGFLLGSRKYKQQCHYFDNGSQLTIKLEELHIEDTGLGVYACDILLEQTVISSAQVNVFIPPNLDALIREK